MTFQKLFAQQNVYAHKISVGPTIAFPSGNAADLYRRSFGASLTGEHRLFKALKVVGSVGYLRLQYRKDIKSRLENYGEKAKTSGAVPFKTGLRYYFGGIYYFDASAGLVFTTGVNHYTSFTYAPAAGACVPIGPAYNLDFGLRYETWKHNSSDISFFGARIALSMIL